MYDLFGQRGWVKLGWRRNRRWIRRRPSFLRLGRAVGVRAAANGVVTGAQRSVHGPNGPPIPRARRWFFGLHVEGKINVKDES